MGSIDNQRQKDILGQKKVEYQSINNRVINLKIIKQQSVARHFLLHKSQQKYDYMIKLIVVGDSSVGKTNIISAFSNPSYQYSNIHVPTIGVDFSSKIIQVQNKKIKLQVWDTAGQQRFRTITETYYKGAAGILLVYSVANRQSFNNIKKWMQSIQQRITESTKIILIANKIDLPDQQKQIQSVESNIINPKKHQSYRVVSKKQGWDLAAQFKIRYHEVSAKMNLKIDQIFYNIAEMINSQIQQETIGSEKTQKNKNKALKSRFQIKHERTIKLQQKNAQFIKLKTGKGITYHKKAQLNESQTSIEVKRTMKNCAC